jgi:predicted aspartyl protease
MIPAMQRALLLALLVVAAVTAWPRDSSAQFYRWVDERGNAHYAEGLDNVPARYRTTATPLGLRNSAAPSAPVRGSEPETAAKETLIRFVPGRHIIVDARINGGATTKLILDTGAGGTLISPRALAAAGVSLTRGTRAATSRGVAKGVEVETVRVIIDSLEVGGARVGRMVVSSYEMDWPDVEGLLGQDFLGQFNVNIDPAAGVVKLTKK